MATLTVRELFDFGGDPAIAEGAELDAELDRLMELASRSARFFCCVGCGCCVGGCQALLTTPSSSPRTPPLWSCSRPPLTAEEEVADAVFAQAYIPRKLEEVMHYERDHARLAAGKDTGG